METIIALLLAIISLLGGVPAQGPVEEPVWEPASVWTQEDQIIFCADYFEDPFEALECMENAEADPTLPTVAEVYGS